MNDDDLRECLHRFRVPDASESARGRALHRALIAFQQGGSMQIEKPRECAWIGAGVVPSS
jgi:hypothetical protein